MNYTWIIILILFHSSLYNTAPLTIIDTNIDNDNPKTQDHLIDIERKEQEVFSLIDKALEYIKNNDLDVACMEFALNSKWHKGEIFIFILDSDGAILSHGKDTDVLWENIDSVCKNMNNKSVFQSIKLVAQDGGWVNFTYHKGDKLSYVKKITIDGEDYIIGAGFFPESEEFFIKYLTKRIADTFNNSGFEITKRLIQNPFGPFIKGDLVPYMNDTQGNVIADSQNLAFVGQNMIDLISDEGVFANKEDLKIAKSPEGAGWVTLRWNGETSKNYIYRLSDLSNKNVYYTGIIYYPYIGRESVMELIHKAISHLKGVGSERAFADFSNKISGYSRGPLSLFVYDFEGNNLANGATPSLIGKNLMNRRDAEGTYYVQEIIKQAKRNGSGSITIAEKNNYKTLYFEAVSVAHKNYIIGSGYFPNSKSHSVKNLVNKGIQFFKTHSMAKTMQFFKDTNEEFVRGDLGLAVYTDTGFCLVNSNQVSDIWKNDFNKIDQKGIRVLEQCISLAKAGGGWLVYKINNIERNLYVKSIVKTNEHTGQTTNYIICSGYYS